MKTESENDREIYYGPDGPGSHLGGIGLRPLGAGAGIHAVDVLGREEWVNIEK